MTTRQQLLFLAGAVCLLLVIIGLISKKRLKGPYSVFWLACSLALVAFAAFFDLVTQFSAFIGAVLPTTTFFLCGILCLVLLNLQFSIKISGLREEIRSISQKAGRIKSLTQHHWHQLESSQDRLSINAVPGDSGQIPAESHAHLLSEKPDTAQKKSILWGRIFSKQQNEVFQKSGYPHESAERKRRSIFERNPKKFLLGIVAAIFLILELVSYAILMITGNHRSLQKDETGYYKYNRTVSGYYVFKNTPNFSYDTIGSGEGRKAVSDKFGFISDKPVSIKKPNGVIRVFLMGGSAAFGAGQTGRYEQIYRYPWGLYSYNSSIAGYLKKFLEQHKPGTTFEVINAASYSRMFHQSMLYYLETVSEFSPDYIINMDGYNDINSIISGDQYGECERNLDYYIRLKLDDKKFYEINIINLIKIVIDKYIFRNQDNKNKFTHTIENFNYIDSNYSYQKYIINKSKWILNSQRFFQIMNQYMAILKSDKINFIFVLQPMLNRKNMNKKLSYIEKKFEKNIAPTYFFHGMYDDGVLCLKYFFDDYMTGALKNAIERNSYQYIDMNSQISYLDSSFEFYTDYCHTTEAGNKIIAEILGQAVLKGIRP